MSDLRADTNVDDLEKGVGDRAASQKRTYDVPEDQIWSVYNGETDKVDRALVERWKGDMDVLLIFAGLFSAVVTAFIIEGYKYLSVDPTDTTVALLNQISMQLAAAANGSQLTLPSQSPLNTSFQASRGIIRVNVCWFLSLTLSLATALAATLAQQWSCCYLQTVQRREVPRIRGRIRCFLFEGVERFRMTAVVEGIPALLHAAVFLFFGGLVEFLLPIDAIVCFFVLGIMSVCGILYTIISILPCLIRQCPFRSPLTPSVWYMLRILTRMRLPHRLSPRSSGTDWRTRIFNKSFNDAQESDAQENHAQLSSPACREREYKAFNWTLGSLTDHDELLPFVDGMPGYLETSPSVGLSLSKQDREGVMLRLFRGSDLLERVVLLLSSHEHSALPRAVVRRRVRACNRLAECAALSENNQPMTSAVRYIGECAMCLTLSQRNDRLHSKSWDEFVGPSFPFKLLFRRFGIHSNSKVSRSSMDVYTILVFLAHIAEHPQWHDMDVTRCTFGALWSPLFHKTWFGDRCVEQKAQHSFVSCCARMEGLEPSTLEREHDDRLNIPSYMRYKILTLLRHVRVSEERRRAIAVIRNSGRWDDPCGVDESLGFGPRFELNDLVRDMRKWEEELARDAERDEHAPSSLWLSESETRMSLRGYGYDVDHHTESTTGDRRSGVPEVNNNAQESQTDSTDERCVPHPVTPPEDQPEEKGSYNADNKGYSSGTAHMALRADRELGRNSTNMENHGAVPSTSSLVAPLDTSPSKDNRSEEPHSNEIV